MRIVIVGGGAAGMMAASIASKSDNEVILIDRNEKLGKKVYITGKGRCNLTNACDLDTFFGNIITNKKFMYSSLYGFTNTDCMAYFEKLGLKIKTERGDRVFPVSDHSSDVIKALERDIKSNGVEVMLNLRMTGVDIKDNCIKGIYTDKRGYILADRVILALGGKSYPSCGADGDTWKVAKALNIKTNPAEPALVPMTVKEDWIGELQGLSLKNVEVTIKQGKKQKYSGFGEMLFTHFGVSGPIILSASSYLKDADYESGLSLYIDLKPALNSLKLDERILRDFSKNQNKKLANSLNELLPSKLIPVVIRLMGINPEKKVNEVKREERERLVRLLKEFPLTVIGNRGFNEAIITRGGISVKEINPQTMESKSIKGLYFSGEMIDIDALTGGFNLQLAWSTGYAAANAACLMEDV